MAFFPSLKHNFLAYHSSKVSSRPDCIFEIHQLWQSGFSRVYSNCYCSCSLEPEIIKIGQSSHRMYSNNVVNFQESTTILKACTKKVWKLIESTTYLFLHICLCIYLSMNLSLNLSNINSIKKVVGWLVYTWLVGCLVDFTVSIFVGLFDGKVSFLPAIIWF